MDSLIAGNLFTANGIAITVDPNNILASLEAVEKLDAKSLQKIADHFKLPTEPLEKKLLKPVVMGEVQNAWYQAFTGSVPEKCAVNQTARIARYVSQLEEVKNNTGEDKVVGSKKASTSGAATQRAANLYRLVESKKDEWGKFKGQKRLIVKVFEAEGAIGPDGKGLSVRFLADNVRDTEETTAPSDKNCAFHINAWGHEGVVARVEEKDGKWVVCDVQKPKSDHSPEPPKDEPKPEPAKKPEQKKPAPTSKKKK